MGLVGEVDDELDDGEVGLVGELELDDDDEFGELGVVGLVVLDELLLFD